jgi:hypothetical protein
MKNNILKTVIIALISISILSCKKEDHDHEPISATVNFIEPSVNDTIAFGEELHIEGTISGTGEMHGYTVSILKINNQEVLFTKSYSNHATMYNFHEHFTNNVTEITNAKVKVDVAKDHDGNHEIKEVNVVFLPE